MRDTRTGTWFIQTLCQILNEHYTELTLDEMIMLVQREVATKEYHIKQMVRYESTLLKKLKFVNPDNNSPKTDNCEKPPHTNSTNISTSRANSKTMLNLFKKLFRD